jgi:hypothetical protein
MHLGQIQSLPVDGMPWPSVQVAHRSMDTLAAVGTGLTETLRTFNVHVEPRHGGPTTAEAMAAWAEYNPAPARRLVNRVIEAQQPTMREKLFLRVHVFQRPGDGVWDLSIDADTPASVRAGLGFDALHPMTRPYATRWDTRGPGEKYRDAFVEIKDDGRGVGCYVHPKMFMLVCPRLRGVITYHSMARPGLQLTREEYLSMSAFEVTCHRLLRDAAVRRGV